MTLPVFVFITGASGSGKTTFLQKLSERLPQQECVIQHFDDIGVPSQKQMITQYGSLEKWQEWALGVWVDRMKSMQDKKVVILEGSFNPDFVVRKIKADDVKNSYYIFCLDAPRYVRERRLIKRGNPELVHRNMENFAQVLRKKTKDLGGIILDSQDENLEKNIEIVLSLVRHSS